MVLDASSRVGVARLVLATAVVAVGSPTPSAAGAARAQEPTTAVLSTISGRVDVQRETAAAEPRPIVSAVGAPAARGTPDRRRSVVYLESAPQGAFESSEAEHAVLDQRNETFIPYVLAVKVGTVVEFTNSDRTYHNVFSLSKAARFDLGRYPKGRSKAVRFDRAGVVRVFCELHSHMSAFVLVFAHRYFAVTDANGHYKIPAVPPGEYAVVAWNDGDVRDSRRVRVPAQGGPVECDFVAR
jgi:plastocyanin